MYTSQNAGYYAGPWEVHVPFGIPEAIVLGPVIVLILFVWPSFWRRSRRLGYGSIGAYLRAAPRTDLEKRDAVDLAFKGGALCALGLIFPPFILGGLVPLFYGGRKVVYASMGLGLIDDADHTGA